MSQTSFKLGVIPGDGIGPEVVAEGLKVLDVIAAKHGLTFERTEYELGAKYWHRTGQTLPDEVMAEMAKQDVLLLGAVGDPTVPSGVLERGLLLKLRFAFDHYINLRPTKLWPGVESPLKNPGDVDFIVVREGTEGPYIGAGGTLQQGTPFEVATEESINTRNGAERAIRYAFEKAKGRPRKKVTLVHKNNVLTRAGGLWTRTFNEVAKEYPEIATDYIHVDAASMFFVTNPSRFDVVVTDNLFGDIITDIAAAISGGIGIAASGNINPTGKFPSMFEPIHGSAPDIAGQNIADPTATILSVALMLTHLGFDAAAQEISDVVSRDLAARAGIKRSTQEIGSALAEALK